MPGSFATSTIERYLIGADACSMSHVNGNTTGGDDAAAARVNGVTVGLGLDEGGGGGRVTEALFEGLNYRTGSSLSRRPAEGRVRIAVLSVCARGRQLSCCAHEACRCAGLGAPVS